MRKQLAAAALSAAAVVGTSGGVAVALTGNPSDTPSTGGRPSSSHSSKPAQETKGTPAPSSTPSSSPSSTPGSSPSSSPSASADPAALLYASQTQIHDGSLTVPFRGPRNVIGVTRANGGWVLTAQPVVDDSDSAELWYVTRAGRTTRFAEFNGPWDLDPSGRQAVARDLETQQISVWDVATGAVVGRTPDGSKDQLAGFVGSQVLLAGSKGNDDVGVLWDAANGESTPQPALGKFAPRLVSPGGSYAAGEVVSTSGSPDQSFCLGVRSVAHTQKPVAWSSCEYRLYSDATTFSPDGTRLLAVPYETDGFGPGRIVAIDASDGPGKLVGDISTPEDTLDAAWAGDSSIFVLGAVKGDPEMKSGSWIARCDLQGKCTRVVTSKEKLGLGSVK